MDIDFADDRRDEVIRYVADKYGRDRVAHIITFGTLGAKAAIRDVGRVLGMSYADVDRIAKLVPGFPLNITLDDAYQKSPPLAEMVKTPANVKELWDIARALEGCTRHASVHASAVVISDEPLDEHIPLYKDPKRPELITGYAMGPIEKLGLLKMDFLGLRTLTVLANTVGADPRGPRGSSIDLDAVPLDDAKTYELLSEAKTFGVFQLESSGMREALRGLRPERLEDVIAMVSLYRPGPMELIPTSSPASTGGPRSPTSTRHGDVHAGDVRDHGLPGADHADRLRDGGLHHGRGRHAAPGHGQEGPRPHGPAAREVRGRLQGARHRRRQGRARLGADGEVRGLRVQQVPHRDTWSRWPTAPASPSRIRKATSSSPRTVPAAGPCVRAIRRSAAPPRQRHALRCTPTTDLHQRGWVDAEARRSDAVASRARPARTRGGRAARSVERPLADAR